MLHCFDILLNISANKFIIETCITACPHFKEALFLTRAHKDGAIDGGDNQ